MAILRFSTALIIFLFLSCSEPPNANEVGEVVVDKAEKLVHTEGFSEQKNAYFGDLHVHSSWSFDAFIYNVRTSPDDAYRFGKGEEIEHAIAGKIQNDRPLDFMCVSDHAEYMGIMMQMLDKNSPLASVDLAQRIRNEDREVSLAAFADVGRSLSRNNPIEELIKKDIISNTWQKQIDIANQHNEPGKFTTFPAYEWTSSPVRGEGADSELYAANMHRNVIYKGGKISDVPFSSFDSQNPEALWTWMEKEKSKGIEMMAIPHNANMSDGLMYGKNTFDGGPIDKAYAELRSKSEPINEVVQIKGQSMSHPVLNPNDEFSDYEIYAYTFSIGPPPPSKPNGSYVREAFGLGLELESEVGANPYNFGVIGSSDGHNSGGPVEEDNYFGKLGNIDGLPEVRLAVDGGDRFLRSKYMSAAGLAGVWAEENTREAIFTSMKRKEVFATSGPRIQVRFFAGSKLENVDFTSTDWIKEAYANGAPMGSNIDASASDPSFIVWAVKDTEGANLDRIQIIKQWLEEDGKAKEKIYDVAWSGDREVDTNGNLPPVGNTVDVADASYSNTIGSVSLSSTWKDPDYKASQSALYFVRVLEIPTPRWTTYDAKSLGITIPDDLDATTQERAWSSPIWVN